MRSLRAFRMADRDERLLQQLLQIRLPHVDDVVDVRGAAEQRVVAFAAGRARRPERSVRPRREHAIVEILPEQPELPELVGDVLADVGDDAVRSDDDLLALFSSSSSELGSWDLGFGIWALGFASRSSWIGITQQPASRPSVLQVDRALRLEHLERLRPELQPQDVALPRQQVVVDVHPRHRLQMASDDPVGDEGGDLGVLVAAMLDVVERFARGPRAAPCPARTTP